MGRVFTAAEAIAQGSTYRQLSNAVRCHQLQRAWRGIYLTSLSARWLERVAAAVHASNGVLSHGTAARLHQLWGFERDEVELTLPPGRRFRRPGIRSHQAELDEADLCPQVAGATSLARTLIDLAGACDELQLATALESAWCRDRHLLDDLERRMETLQARGRKGLRRLRRLMADARERGRPLESPLEVRCWLLLRSWKVPLPQPGVEVDDGGRKVLRFDFLYAAQRLAIEADGYRWHRTHEQFASDCERQSRAAALGYRVMRLTWSDLDAPELLRERLLVALGLAVLPHRTRWGKELPWPTTSFPAERSADEALPSTAASTPEKSSGSTLGRSPPLRTPAS